MTHIRLHYILIILLIVFVTSCKKHNVISIKEYGYCDSIAYNDPHGEYAIGILSEVNFSLIGTESDAPDDQRTVKNINNFIINIITSQYKDEDPDSIAKHIAETNLTNLLSNVSERELSRINDTTYIHPIYDFNELSDTLFNKIHTECHIGRCDTVLCVSGRMMLYSGGAHPGEESFAYSFSLNDGNMLRINKLFKNGYQDELTHRIKLKLMEMQNVETEKELNARGFEEIGISPYFLLEKDGIIFRYESYTIAPFYVGDIDIKFSYEEIQDLMND